MDSDGSKPRALIVTTVSGFVPQFEMQRVELLQQMGYEVHYAANYNTPVYGNNSRLDGSGIVKHQVDFDKSPFSFANRKAYRQLKQVLQLGFDLVHCHTPVGGALARLATRKYRPKTKVIYTAHGFHFYKGASIRNWMIFYPVEKFLSRFTDVQITINEEDYERARRNWNCKVEYIPGIGMKLDGSYMQHAKLTHDQQVVLVSVGELTKRKNHQVILHAIARLPESYRNNLTYVICGSGGQESILRKQIMELGIEGNVVLAGYVNTVDKYLKDADAFVFPSLQEGLPVALMEGMRQGLWCIVSDVRGNRELVRHGENGQIIEESDPDAYCQGIVDFMDHVEEIDWEQVWSLNSHILRKYDASQVKEKMAEIYKEVLQ